MPTTCKLIAKTTLGSSASNIEFASIPGTYTDLLLFASLRTDRSTEVDIVFARFNGATSDTNHSSRNLFGNGSNAGSGTTAYARLAYAPSTAATSNTFGNLEFYIPNYAGSTNKSYSAVGLQEDNATNAFMSADAGLWSSTNAITGVRLLPLLGTNFVSGSSAHLYGITKSA